MMSRPTRIALWRWEDQLRPCRQNGCQELIIYANGLCQKHYAQSKKQLRVLRLVEEKKCLQCGEKHYARGLCRRHYQQQYWKDNYGGGKRIDARLPRQKEKKE